MRIGIFRIGDDEHVLLIERSAEHDDTLPDEACRQSADEAPAYFDTTSWAGCEREAAGEAA